MRISMKGSRKILGGLWILWFLGALAVIQLQINNDYYGRDADQVWDWFLPHVTPTIGLIGGVAVKDFLAESPKERPADLYWFAITFVLCLFYIVAVSSAFILAPSAVEDSALTFLKGYDKILAVSQGLLAGFLAFFFVKGSEEEQAEKTRNG